VFEHLDLSRSMARYFLVRSSARAATTPRRDDEGRLGGGSSALGSAAISGTPLLAAGGAGSVLVTAGMLGPATLPPGGGADTGARDSQARDVGETNGDVFQALERRARPTRQEQPAARIQK
jgi:hypothetical protein